MATASTPKTWPTQVDYARVTRQIEEAHRQLERLHLDLLAFHDDTGVMEDDTTAPTPEDVGRLTVFVRCADLSLGSMRADLEGLEKSLSVFAIHAEDVFAREAVNA